MLCVCWVYLFSSTLLLNTHLETPKLITAELKKKRMCYLNLRIENMSMHTSPSGNHRRKWSQDFKYADDPFNKIMDLHENLFLSRQELPSPGPWH